MRYIPALDPDINPPIEPLTLSGSFLFFRYLHGTMPPHRSSQDALISDGHAPRTEKRHAFRGMTDEMKNHTHWVLCLQDI
jgi:hypothetical protein